MTYDKEHLDPENQDVLERNIEESKKVIKAKRAQRELEHEQDMSEQPPVPRDDPRYGDQAVPPGQQNVPSGGTTGGQIRAGGGSKSSRNG